MFQGAAATYLEDVTTLATGTTPPRTCWEALAWETLVERIAESILFVCLLRNLDLCVVSVSVEVGPFFVAVRKIGAEGGGVGCYYLKVGRRRKMMIT